MTTPLLLRFSTSLVDRLVANGRLLVRPGRSAAVAEHLAGDLASPRLASLVSTVVASLLAAEDVEDLFADNEEIQTLIDGLDLRAAGLRAT